MQLLPLTPTALSWWARWRESDPAGRLIIEGKLLPDEARALRQLADNLAAMPHRSDWLTGTTRLSLTRQAEEILFRNLYLPIPRPGVIAMLARACATWGHAQLAVEEAARRRFAGDYRAAPPPPPPPAEPAPPPDPRRVPPAPPTLPPPAITYETVPRPPLRSDTSWLRHLGRPARPTTQPSQENTPMPETAPAVAVPMRSNGKPYPPTAITILHWFREQGLDPHTPLSPDESERCAIAVGCSTHTVRTYMSLVREMDAPPADPPASASLPTEVDAAAAAAPAKPGASGADSSAAVPPPPPTIQHAGADDPKSDTAAPRGAATDAGELAFRMPFHFTAHQRYQVMQLATVGSLDEEDELAVDLGVRMRQLVAAAAVLRYVDQLIVVHSTQEDPSC